MIDLKIFSLFGFGGIHFHWHAAEKKSESSVEGYATKELARLTRASAAMAEFQRSLHGPNGRHKDLKGTTVLVLRDEDGRGEWYAYVPHMWGARPRFSWKRIEGNGYTKVPVATPTSLSPPAS